MKEYLFNHTSFLFTSGFLDTRAYLYMDIIVTFLVFLPIFIGFSIFIAGKRFFLLHQFFQILLFLTSLIALGSFAYIIHYHEGFTTLARQSSMNNQTLYYILIAHIVIASLTMISWLSIIVYASKDRRRRTLPGMYSSNHKRAGRRVWFSICLTSLSGVLLYWTLFVK